nr:MAG TPA_asm: hypothetical protein [Caudoviricetes sp.]
MEDCKLQSSIYHKFFSCCFYLTLEDCKYTIIRISC